MSEVLTIMGMANTITFTVDEFDAPRITKFSGTGMAGAKISFTLTVEPDGDDASVATVDAEFISQMMVGAIGGAIERASTKELNESLDKLRLCRLTSINQSEKETRMGSLENRVAIVTGAGRGIGREHALLLAKEGASVVVNDLGGANDGSGADVGPAQEVANEIVSAGGNAVANTDNIATWDGAKSLVDRAISEFGGLDVVVNNAGILRDGFIASMDESQWDSVIAVHLKGHFSVLRRAAGYWKEQSKAGKPVNAAVINTASASGTFMANAGQANYGAAKAGIAAITEVAALELERYGVRVNAIAPVARTRLTLATPGMSAMFAEEVPEGEFDAFSPANIAPVVAYLAAEKCPLTGKVLAVQGGAITLLKGWTSVETVETDGPWLLDELPNQLGHWAEQA